MSNSSRMNWSRSLSEIDLPSKPEGLVSLRVSEVVVLAVRGERSGMIDSGPFVRGMRGTVAVRFSVRKKVCRKTISCLSCWI